MSHNIQMWSGGMEIRDETLVRYVVGEATREEREAVRAWRRLSRENAARLIRLEETWNRAGEALSRGATPAPGRAEMALRQLRVRMESGRLMRGGRPFGHTRKRGGFAPFQAAAAIALLAGGLAGVLHWSRPAPDETRVFSSQVSQISDVWLTDGTRITLAPASRLTVAPRYGVDTRAFKLEGRALFKVAPGVSAPFVVRANGSVIHALGTTFDVSAYPEDEEVRAVTVEGLVRFEAEDGPADWTLTLEPGELVRYRRRDGEITKDQVHVDRHVAWAEGRLVLDDQPLGTVLRELERWYGFNFRVESDDLLEMRFTGDFRFESLREIVDVIAYTVDLVHVRRGDTIEFRRR